MKKKLLLTLIVGAMLTLLLALGISAASTNEFGTVEPLAGMSEKSGFGADGTAEGYTSRVVLFDGNEYHTYPSYYIFTNNPSNVSVDFQEIREKTGKQYDRSSIIRVEVPHNVTKLDANVFWQNRSVKYVLLPDTLTEISGNTFSEAHGLEWVNIPRDCTVIRNRAFFGCASLITVDMTKAKSLKRVEENQFYNCPKLEELIFPEGLEYFGGAGGGGPTYQNGLGSLKVLYLPDSVTYMGTIAEMKSIGTFVVPLGVTSLKANQFSYCTGLKTIVVHSGVTSVATNAFEMTFYIENIVYTGQELTTENAAVTGLKSYTRNDGKKPTFTYGNHCKYYYDDQHLNDTNPCVINCSRCNAYGVAKENPVHSEYFTILYANGYDSTGSKLTACSNEGCPYEESQEANALFTCLGYSAPTFSAVGGIALGYTVNTTAIAEFTEATGATLRYGVFAVGKEKLGDNEVFAENGTPAGGVISAEISNLEFVAFELAIVGFTDDYKAAPLAMGAFVKVTKDGTTTYSYMQDTTKGEKVGNYYFASYSDVIGK